MSRETLITLGLLKGGVHWLTSSTQVAWKEAPNFVSKSERRQRYGNIGFINWSCWRELLKFCVRKRKYVLLITNVLQDALSAWRNEVVSGNRQQAVAVVIILQERSINSQNTIVGCKQRCSRQVTYNTAHAYFTGKDCSTYRYKFIYKPIPIYFFLI